MQNPPTDSKPDGTVVLLLIPMITISLVYGYLLFLVFRSLNKVKRNPQAITFGKVFYFIIFISVLARIVSFVIMALELLSYLDSSDTHVASDLFGVVFLSLNYLPDLFLVLCFSIYGWLVLLIYLLGLIHLPHPKLTKPTFRNGFFVTWLCLLVGIELAQIAGFLLYWFNAATFSFSSYILLDSITNLIIGASVVITEISFHFVFSGIPFKADFHSKRFWRVNRILLYWGLACAFKGSINIYQKDNIEAVWTAIIEGTTSAIDSILPPLLLILQIFLTEIVPLLLVNDSKIRNYLFIKSEHESADHAAPTSLTENLLRPDNANVTSGEEVVISAGQRGGSVSTSDKDRKTIGPSSIVSQKNVLLGKKDEQFGDKELGVYYFAKNKDETIKARVIRLKKITPYLAEEVNREIVRYLQFTSPNLIRVRGLYVQDPEVTIYYESIEATSLYDLLHKRQETSQKLDLSLKIKIALQIAKALNYLHSQNPKVIHSHLNPKLIYLDKEHIVKIGDYGLSNLKKYANIMGGYTHVSQYTAPEIFSDTGAILIPDNIKADIYSFGMILWQLVSEKVPFEGLGLQDLHQMICVESSRPKIPEGTSEDVQSVIRACWQQDPAKRPGLEEIIALLRDELE